MAISIKDSKTNSSPKRLPNLDILRGLAAGLIFLFHFFALYKPEKGAQWDNLNYYISRYFGMGVPLFFALSGLSLYFGYFNQRNAPNFTKEFIIRRYFRIAPLFYLAYLAWLSIFISRGVEFQFDTFILNASLAFNIVPGKHESLVAAGWSVGVEVIFYGLFPLIVTFINSNRRALIGLAGALLFSTYAYQQIKLALPNSSCAEFAFASHIPFFSLGITVFFLQQHLPLQQSSLRRGLACVMLIGIFVISIWVLASGWLYSISSPPVSVMRLLWALPIGTILLLACWGSLPIVTAPLEKLGHWSFSLYLLHPLIIYFHNEYAVKHLFLTLSPSVRFGLFLLIAASSLVALSALTYRYIEQPGIRLGRWLTKRRDVMQEDRSIAPGVNEDSNPVVKT